MAAIRKFLIPINCLEYSASFQQLFHWPPVKNASIQNSALPVFLTGISSPSIASHEATVAAPKAAIIRRSSNEREHPP
jgi:hypothetical protein